MWNNRGQKTLSPVVRTVKPMADIPSRGVSYELTLHGEAFAALLKEMQRRSTLTTRALSKKLGVEPNSINQYFYKKRGMGGSSTMKWFLRFAEACGCRLYLTFPTAETVRYLERMPPKAPILFGVGGPETPCDP